MNCPAQPFAPPAKKKVKTHHNPALIVNIQHTDITVFTSLHQELWSIKS
jgi:hypothetical protein